MFRRVVVATFVLLLSCSVRAQALDPYRAPNLSPPLAIIGLPVWAGVPARTTVGMTTELANHYRLSQRGDEILVLDGETFRVRAYLEKPFGKQWSVGVDVPFVRQSGGVLDNLIDAWHSAFGMPDGGRNHRPENVLQFQLADAGGTFYALTEPGAGLGDIRVSLAKRLPRANGWTFRGTLKLPTGRESLLAGSGATDLTLSMLQMHNGDVRGHAAGFHYGAALIAIGQPDNVRFPAENHAVAAVLGGGISLTERLGIKGQIDINTRLYDSRLQEIGLTAVQATIGAWRRFGDSALFEFAVSEDLHVSTTPDVVLFFGLSWRL